MPASYYHERFSFSTLPATVLFSALTDKDGQTIPSTFTNVPTVNVFSKVSRPLFIVDGSVTVTQFQVDGGVGGAAPPWLGDIEVLSSDPAAAAPPASTDLTESTPEPMCTPLDILIAAQLPIQSTNIWELMNLCILERAIVGELSRIYGESQLRAAVPWASLPMPGSIFQDERGETSVIPTNLGLEGINELGLRVAKISATVSAVFTQLYVVKFDDDAGAFTVTAQIEGTMGSGTTSADFISSNGDVRIQTDAWIGTPRKDSRFYFSVYRWLPEIVMMAKLRAAASLIELKYQEDGIGDNKLASAYRKRVDMDIKAYLDPWGDKGKKLPTYSKPKFGVLAKPHDITFAGQDATKYSSGNKDFLGNRGEFVGFDLVNIDTDLWGL